MIFANLLYLIVKGNPVKSNQLFTQLFNQLLIGSINSINVLLAFY